MKITSLISASAMVLALAAPVYAQTAPTTPATPATPAPTTPTPATPAPTTPAPAPTGIPAAYAGVPIIKQVDAQLTAQGYTITDVVKNADGSYSILSTGPTGGLRLITVNPATGAVVDTVTGGVPAGTGVGEDGHFEDDGDMETDDGSESDSDGEDDSERSHGGGSDSDRGHGDSDSEGGSDSDD